MIVRLARLLRQVCRLSVPCAEAPAADALAELRAAFEAVRREELARGPASPELERFSRSLVERLLSEPARRLPRLAAAGADPEELADAVRLLCADWSAPCPGTSTKSPSSSSGRPPARATWPAATAARTPSPAPCPAS